MPAVSESRKEWLMNSLPTDDTEVRLFIFGSADVEKPVALWVVSGR